jgi:hypothetical protein
MEDFAEDFEAPIDGGGTDSADDPFAEIESPPPQEESPPTWEIPYEPPVQPAPDPYADVRPLIDGVQDIGEYTRRVIEEAGNRFEKNWSERQLRDRVETSEVRAKEVFNGEDGLPSYSELVDHYVVPILRQRPDITQLVMACPDPASASYLLGFCAKFPHLTERACTLAAKNGKIDARALRSLVQGNNFRPTVQGNGSGRRQPSGKVNYADWDNESFEAELDRFKMSGE